MQAGERRQCAEGLTCDVDVSDRPLSWVGGVVRLFRCVTLTVTGPGGICKLYERATSGTGDGPRRTDPWCALAAGDGAAAGLGFFT